MPRRQLAHCVLRARRRKEHRCQFERWILQASRTYYLHSTRRQNEPRGLKRVGRLIEERRYLEFVTTHRFSVTGVKCSAANKYGAHLNDLFFSCGVFAQQQMTWYQRHSLEHFINKQKTVTSPVRPIDRSGCTWNMLWSTDRKFTQWVVFEFVVMNRVGK